MQWRKRWHFKLNERSLYNTLSILLVLGRNIYMWQQHSGHEELLWKLMHFPVFEMKMESREWEYWLSLQRCPPATIMFVKLSWFSVLKKKAAWTGSEQMQFVGSISNWCSSLRREFPGAWQSQLAAWTVQATARRPKQNFTNLSIFPCTVLSWEGMQVRPENLKAKDCFVGCLATHAGVHTQSGEWELVQGPCYTGRVNWAVKVSFPLSNKVNDSWGSYTGSWVLYTQPHVLRGFCSLHCLVKYRSKSLWPEGKW